MDSPPPYRLAGVLAAIFYAFLGLFFLRKLLRLFFSDKLTAITLVAYALGTGLLHYTVHEPAMTHIYSFCFMAMLSLYMVRWHRSGRWWDLFWLAVAAGLILLIRLTNGVVFLLPLLYGIGGSFTWVGKAQWLWKKRWHVLGAIVVGLLVLSPQLLYWKWVGGSWSLYSYGDEGFLWNEPMIGEVLWGYHKGWWVYTPLMFLASLGLFFLPRYAQNFSWALPIYLVINVYIVSCWWCWWYGGSFGMRALLEMSAPLAVAFTALLQWAYRYPWSRLAVLVLLPSLICLNLFQTYQYKKSIIHWADMTQEAYWAVFGRLEFSPEEWQQLQSLYESPQGGDRRQRSHRTD